MSQLLQFVEVNYHYHREFDQPADVLRLHGPSNLFTKELKKQATITLVKHLQYSGNDMKDGIEIAFYPSRSSFIHIPSLSHRYIYSKKPQLVLVQGFIFPIQVMALRKKLGREAVILLQHHGERPFAKKKILQQLADRSVDGYLFTSLCSGIEWQTSGIIRDPRKCFELPSSTTNFQPQTKSVCKEAKGLNGNFNFLWVGRLDDNKDPLTVMKAFAQYAGTNAFARLYMVYQQNDLLPAVRQMIEEQPVLKQSVVLLGKLPNAELEQWYNAADYYVSGSYHEGGSYALTEAMACGCIPIVTNIPAAMKAIDYGRAGYYFEPGDKDSLLNVLQQLQAEDQKGMSEIVRQTFEAELSAAAIADKLLKIYSYLKNR